MMNKWRSKLHNELFNVEEILENDTKRIYNKIERLFEEVIEQAIISGLDMGTFNGINNRNVKYENLVKEFDL